MRIFTLCGPRLRAAAAILATLSLATPATAQYAGYAGQPQYGVQNGTQYAAPYAGPGQYAAQPSQATPPQYAAQGAYQGYAPQPGYVPQTPIGAQNQTYQPQNYQAQNYGPYNAPHMAMAQPTAAASAPAETLPLTPPAEQVAPGAMQGGAYVPQPTPAADYGYGPATGGGYESYPAAQGAPGCATGGCNTGYGAPAASCGAPYGACDTYSTYGGMGGVLGKHGGCGYWFGGVYGLYMDRDNSNKYSLAYVTDPSMPTAYPNTPPDVVMTTRDADVGFQPGVEFRLGRAFGGGGCDPCGGCGCGPTWGLEAVYWTLFDQDASASYYNPNSTSRTYTMMPMYGLEYNHGSGYYPVNEYWDHGSPSMPSNPIRVTRVVTRSSFQVQNLELNMLRLNICGGGFGAGGCSASYGASACNGGCDTGYGGCATGGCDTGCTTGCAPCGPRLPRYSCTAVCGFRWMQFDEDFMFGDEYYNPAWPTTTGILNYNATTENNLLGAQIGCNGMYRIGCKWGFHLNTLVGLYGNDIDVHQYFNMPNVRYIGTQEAFGDVNASKTDVAMMGELRLGASYQATCHCSIYGGWRAIGISGIALATDQTPNAFLNGNQMGSYVNSNGSMILHGLQTGVTWNY